MILCREPVLAYLWTLDSALNVLARTSGRLVAKSTVLRKLRDLGSSFDDLVSNLTLEDSRLERARDLKRVKRGNLYVLREIRSSDFVASAEQLSGLVAVRADNFALCLLRERRHITSQFYKEFLLRLLSHHQGRHVIVLRQMGSAKREEYLSSVAGYYRRLHLV